MNEQFILVFITLIIIIITILYLFQLDSKNNKSNSTKRKDSKRYVDYLIVGAGVCGTYLAYNLSRKYPKAKILIIEVNDSIGGRLLSVSLPKSEIAAEHGGMRFFRDVHTLTAKWVDKMGLKTTFVPNFVPDNVYYLRRLHTTGANLTKDAPQVYNLRKDEVGKSPQDFFNVINESVDHNKFLTHHKGADNLKTMMISTFFSFWNRFLTFFSTEALDYYEDSSGYDFSKTNVNLEIITREDSLLINVNDQQEFVIDGYQQLPEQLWIQSFNNVNLLLNTQLISFNVSENEIISTICGNGENSLDTGIIKSKYLILTPLPSIIKKLYPWPNSLIDVFNKLHPFMILKIFIRYKNPWWIELGYPNQPAGKNITDGPMRQVWFYASNTIMIYTTAGSVEYWIPFLPNVKQGEFHSINLFPLLIEKIDTFLIEMFQLSRAERRHFVREQLKQAEAFELSFKLWQDGIYFWEPFDSNKANEKRNKKGKETLEQLQEVLLNPIPNTNVHLCNEVYSDLPGWVEGALRFSNQLLEGLK